MLLLQFVALQILDLTTTLIFLRHGVLEGNPIVRAALTLPVTPVFLLALIKAAAIGLALIGWRTGRRRLFAKINLLFACCVVWNVAAVLAA